MICFPRLPSAALARSLCRLHHRTSAGKQLPRASAIPLSLHHDIVANELSSSLCQLRLQGDSPVSAHFRAMARQHQQVEYKLPALSNGFLPKQTILDPVTSPQVYQLPTHSGVVIEKLTPSLMNVTPIRDPNPLQQIIDQGAPPVTKECMPYLMRIRKRKMKKHKLRKLRKRMIFLNRKLAEIKKAKKEKKMVAYEAMWAERGRSFNADKWVEDRLDQARKGGWGIDVWQEYRMKSKTVQTERKN